MSDVRAVRDLGFPVRPRIQKTPWTDGYEMWLIGYDIRGTDYKNAKRYCVTEVGLSELGDMGALPASTMWVPNDEAQQWMDELWRAGVRPTEVGTAGHVAALEGERDYLRSLVDRVLPSAVRERA